MLNECRGELDTSKPVVHEEMLSGDDDEELKKDGF